MAPALTRAEAEARIIARQNEYAEKIRQALSEAERLMLERVTKRIERGIDSTGWAELKLAEITKVNEDAGIMVADLRKLDPLIEEAINKAYEAGADQAAAELIEANLTDIGANIALTRGTALRTLTEATIGSMRATELRILRSTNDAYRSIIAQASQQPLLGTMTRRQAAQVALNQFADRGITGFVDSKGRNWDIASYAEMATRSATNQAAVQGHIDKLTDNERDLVIISDSPEECPLCRPWEGKILSISGQSDEYPALQSAIGAGLFHANCTHRTHLYIDGLTRPYENTENPDGYKERQKQRYNERMIRQWKRREAVAVEDSDKRLAMAKRKEWQAKQKAFIEDNDRRRDYRREQITGAR